MEPRRHPRTPTAGALLALLLAAACATPQPVTQVGLNRETPEATYDYFKTVARANQWAAEWAVFSPNFKRSLNELAGRVVDLGDYVTARQTMATNGQADMAMLLNSQLVGAARMVGPDRASITISAGGRTISPTLVRLTRWELKISGEDEPASGFVASAGDAIHVNEDGSITVRVRTTPAAAGYLRTVPRDRIDSFAVRSEWYVDDFGGLDRVVGAGTPAPAPTTPGAAPAVPPPATPSGATGYGSPDG